MRKFVLTENADGGWLIEESNGDSFYPQTEKPTAAGMIARLQQLLDVGPVLPQRTPERIEIQA